MKEIINSQAIEVVENLREDIMNSRQNEVVKFKLNKINITNGSILIDDNILDDKSVSKLCKKIKVLNTFIDYKKQLRDEDWDDLQGKLESLNKDTDFYASVSENNVIQDIYSKDELESGSFNSLESYNNFLDSITKALKLTDFKYTVKSAKFDNRQNRVSLKMLHEDSNIDVFGNHSDMWKSGIDLNFNSVDFSSSPFFERLICTNGMTASNYGYSTNIQQSKWDYAKIDKQVSKILINDSKSNSMIIECAQNLSMNDVSVKEFLQYKRFIESINEDDKYSNILDSVFSEEDIIKNYGVEIRNKSKKWQSMATSGRNAYGFFNDLTYIASHPEETGMNSVDGRELSILSSKLFFNKNLDLQDVPEQIHFAVDKFYQD